MFLITLKLKKCVGMQLKKLSYLFKYVPDQYKTQQMCNKAILEHGGTCRYLTVGIYPFYNKNGS